MRSLPQAFLVLLFLSIFTSAQTSKPKASTGIPSAVPVKKTIKTGWVTDRTYTDPVFGFEITFPPAWQIAGDDFEMEMKKRGFDLSLKGPESLPIATRTRLDRAVKNVEILLTAYRAAPGSPNTAIVRVSVEDLSSQPQIKDAVDYFDAVRAAYAGMKLPSDLKYSDTQAEKLGAQQFAYLDVTNRAGRKRMYATVRHDHVVQFTLSYERVEDLEAFRRVLAEGNFKLKVTANSPSL